MKCKFCGAELVDGVTRCPECGAEGSANKLPAGKIALLAVLGIIAAAVVVALVMGGLNMGDTTPETTVPSVPDESQAVSTIPADGNPEDVTCKGTYTVSDEALLPLLENVAATVGNDPLTNADLQIYYWMQFYDFLEMYSSYAAYLGLDVYAPLDTQTSLDGTTTWQQFFLDGALNVWHSYAALCEAAKAAGYEMPEEYRDELDALPSTMAESAASMGFENALAMVQADMGPGATLESYIAFMEDYYLANLYYTHCLEQITVTDEEVDAYFTEHAAEYAENGLDKTTRFVDVRHILILPQGGTTENGVTTYSDEEWEICRQSAQAILDAYLAGELTEERFANLANTYSEDPGSNTKGGLYTDVYVGQMVAPFEEWCFDETRVTGDTGLVKTSYGYHVMFFVSSEEAWYETAYNDLMADKGEQMLNEILETYPLNVDYSAIALGLVDFAALG